MNRRVFLVSMGACITPTKAAFLQGAPPVTVPLHEWWNMDDPRMVLHESGDHHWYEQSCCNDHDCRGFDASLVTELNNGDVVLSLPAFGTFKGMDIIFPKRMIRERPEGSHIDLLWHFCFQVYKYLDGHLDAGVKCAYPPSPTT